MRKRTPCQKQIKRNELIDHLRIVADRLDHEHRPKERLQLLKEIHRRKNRVESNPEPPMVEYIAYGLRAANGFLKNTFEKFEQWYDVHIGWFHVNPNKQDKWEKYLKEKHNKNA